MGGCPGPVVSSTGIWFGPTAEPVSLVWLPLMREPHSMEFLGILGSPPAKATDLYKRQRAEPRFLSVLLASSRSTAHPPRIKILVLRTLGPCLWVSTWSHSHKDFDWTHLSLWLRTSVHTSLQDPLRVQLVEGKTIKDYPQSVTVASSGWVSPLVVLRFSGLWFLVLPLWAVVLPSSWSFWFCWRKGAFSGTPSCWTSPPTIRIVRILSVWAGSAW